MTSRIIGRRPCLLACGFESAHVKESEKCLYMYCPGCYTNGPHAKTEQQRQLMTKGMRPEGGTPVPPPPEPAPKPDPTTEPEPAPPEPTPTPTPTPKPASKPAKAPKAPTRRPTPSPTPEPEPAPAKKAAGWSGGFF